jgi:hypothetical protein
MMSTLARRARRRGLDGAIETRVCSPESLGIADLAGEADLALAFHVVHETTHPKRFLTETFEALRPGGKLLLAEPLGHVSEGDRAFIFELAAGSGFLRRGVLPSKRSQVVSFEKPAAE